MFPKVVFIFGTRPEAIKLAPVIKTFKESTAFDVKVCLTGQHDEMLSQVMKVFELSSDINLKIMNPNQSLTSITCAALDGVSDFLAEENPDVVIVQGDTTTTFAAGLAAFYQDTPVWHVEAGLRTGDLKNPWPEEANRKMVSVFASHHFAPTNLSKNNLLDEGADEQSVSVTGNTVIDALLIVRDRLETDSRLKSELAEQFGFLRPDTRMLLVTAHRRENFRGGIHSLCVALKRLAEELDIDVVFPVHLNPNVKGPVNEILAECDNIHLLEPQDYLPFVYLMSRSHVILSDSGGVQEEAPSLGKPVLVARKTTERPEGVEAGTVKLVGTDEEHIVEEVRALFEDQARYDAVARIENPYGDGTASSRILQHALNVL